MSDPGPDSMAADSAAADSAERPLVLSLVAVFAAGVLGTGARLLLDASIPVQPGGVPGPTLAVNTLGSFLLGMAVSVVSNRTPEWLRAGLTTGLLGSFTTFSAVTVASVALTSSDRLLDASVALAVSVIGGVGAAIAGIVAGRALRRSRS